MWPLTMFSGLLRSFRTPTSRFLVSCCNVDGKLFLLEQRGDSVSVRVLHETPSTGLALSANEHQIFAAHPDGVQTFDCRLSLLPEEEYRMPGADVHDLVCIDTSLIVVETSFNRVASYSAPDSVEWSWAPSPGSGDRCHVNSLAFHDGTLYASMFTPEGLGEPWRERLDGAIVEIPTGRSIGGRVLRRGIQQPHSLAVVGETLWLCESRRKRILRLDLSRDSEFAMVVELPAYTRGLAITDDWIVVGQSRSDAHFVRPLLGKNETQSKGMCGVWFISLSSNERFFVDLPAMEVYDILELPG